MIDCHSVTCSELSQLTLTLSPLALTGQVVVHSSAPVVNVQRKGPR